MASNKSKGSSFEQEFCKMMAEYGFWVHNLANRKNGQPFDVIAAKDNQIFAVDCKTCKNDRFDFERIEYNQELAMDAMRDAGCLYSCFAMKMDDGRVFMQTWAAIKNMKESGSNSLKVSECMPFEWWVAKWI